MQQEDATNVDANKPALPSTIVVSIAHFASWRTRGCLRLVCKAWKDAINQTISSAGIPDEEALLPPDITALSDILPSFPNLTKLRVSPAQLLQLPTCPNRRTVTSITIRSDMALTQQAYGRANVAVSLRTLAGFPRLDRLSIQDCLLKEGLDLALHLRSLVTLDLSSVFEVTNKMLSQAQQLPALRHLSLPAPACHAPRFNACTAQGFSLILPGLRRLRTLRLVTPDLEPHGKETIRHLQPCPVLAPSSLKALCSMQLQELALESLGEVSVLRTSGGSDVRMSSSGTAQQIPFVTPAGQLLVCAHEGPISAALATALASCTSLTSLSLAPHVGVEFAEGVIHPLMSRMPSSTLAALEDAGEADILASPHLHNHQHQHQQPLIVVGTNPTPSSLQQPGSHRPPSSGGEIAAPGAAMPRVPSSLGAASVQAAPSPPLTPGGGLVAGAPAAGAPSRGRLGLHIGDPLVSTLATHLTHLRSLCLKDCWALTPAALRSIGDGLRGLTSLDLTGSCRLVPAEELSCLSALTDLRALSLRRWGLPGWRLPHTWRASLALMEAKYTEMWGEGSDDEEGSCHEDDAALPAGNDRYSSGAAEGGGQYAAGLTQRVASADPAILSLMDEVVLSRLAAKLGIELEAVPPHTSQQGQVTAAGHQEPSEGLRPRASSVPYMGGAGAQAAGGGGTQTTTAAGGAGAVTYHPASQGGTPKAAPGHNAIGMVAPGSGAHHLPPAGGQGGVPDLHEVQQQLGSQASIDSAGSQQGSGTTAKPLGRVGARGMSYQDINSGDFMIDGLPSASRSEALTGASSQATLLDEGTPVRQVSHGSYHRVTPPPHLTLLEPITGSEPSSPMPSFLMPSLNNSGKLGSSQSHGQDKGGTLQDQGSQEHHQPHQHQQQQQHGSGGHGQIVGITFDQRSSPGVPLQDNNKQESSMAPPLETCITQAEQPHGYPSTSSTATYTTERTSTARTSAPPAGMHVPPAAVIGTAIAAGTTIDTVSFTAGSGSPAHSAPLFKVREGHTSSTQSHTPPLQGQGPQAFPFGGADTPTLRPGRMSGSGVLHTPSGVVAVPPNELSGTSSTQVPPASHSAVIATTLRRALVKQRKAAELGLRQASADGQLGVGGALRGPGFASTGHVGVAGSTAALPPLPSGYTYPSGSTRHPHSSTVGTGGTFGGTAPRRQRSSEASGAVTDTTIVAALGALSAAHPRLTSLDLSGWQGVGQQALGALFCGRGAGNSIQTLRLAGCEVHSSMFRPLESCAPSLLHLDLSYTLPTPGVCTALRTLPYLEVLELAYAKLTWQASKMVCKLRDERDVRLLGFANVNISYTNLTGLATNSGRIQLVRRKGAVAPK